MPVQCLDLMLGRNTKITHLQSSLSFNNFHSVSAPFPNRFPRGFISFLPFSPSFLRVGTRSYSLHPFIRFPSSVRKFHPDFHRFPSSFYLFSSGYLHLFYQFSLAFLEFPSGFLKFPPVAFEFPSHSFECPSILFEFLVVSISFLPNPRQDAFCTEEVFP